jgi:Matrixin
MSQTILPPVPVGTPRWSKLDLTWAVEDGTILNRIPRESLIGVLTLAWFDWTNVCGIQVEMVPPGGAGIDILFRAAEIDGPWGLVALSEPPDETNEPRVVTFDRDEWWCLDHCPVFEGIVLSIVARHEIGHVLGMPHLPPGNAMADDYADLLQVKKLSDRDIAEAVLRYGRPGCVPSFLFG